MVGTNNACGGLATESSRAWRAVARDCGIVRRPISPGQAPHGGRERARANADAAVGRLQHLVTRVRPFDDPTCGDCTNACGRAPQIVAAAALAEKHDEQALTVIQRVAIAHAEDVERGLAKVRAKEWQQWMNGGSARGLGRQHRFTRVVHGWVPDACGGAGARQRPDDSRGDGKHGQAGEHGEHGDHRLRVAEAAGAGPLGVQATVERQADLWAEIWGEGKDLPRPNWPSDMGRMPRRPTVGEVRAAAKTFPWNTGLAWDQLHPRLVNDLSDIMVEELITIMTDAEASGEWPEAVGVVNTVLLPKPGTTGFRPIGLFPMMIRLWMRIRRDDAANWGAAHSRQYFYAGQARGAQVAAWQHAARAEASALAKASFAQLLLDLETAFENVPHTLLAEEAAAVNDPPSG